jgi:hypothetical protein
MTDFDTKNHWIIDRGDGSPSVNLVVLNFVNPSKLLNQTNDAGDDERRRHFAGQDSRYTSGV